MLGWATWMSLEAVAESPLSQNICKSVTDWSLVRTFSTHLSTQHLSIYICTDTIISSFTADYLSTYLSLVPSPSDAVLSFGPMDFLLTSAPHYLPTRLFNVFPHPAQDQGEKRKYIVMLTSRNADVPRALVRDMYTKSWSAFDRLVAVVPPGGSIGYAFYHTRFNVHPLTTLPVDSTTSYSASGSSKATATPCRT